MASITAPELAILGLQNSIAPTQQQLSKGAVVDSLEQSGCLVGPQEMERNRSRLATLELHLVLTPLEGRGGRIPDGKKHLKFRRGMRPMLEKDNLEESESKEVSPLRHPAIRDVYGRGSVSSLDIRSMETLRLESKAFSPSFPS